MKDDSELLEMTTKNLYRNYRSLIKKVVSFSIHLVFMITLELVTRDGVY